MEKTVYIMRGVPGSGKSTYVEKKRKELLSKTGHIDSVVCSADHFFIDHDGNYKFDPKKLGAAHKFCQDKFMFMVEPFSTVDTIFVDNTNTTVKEMEFYVNACKAANVPFKIVNVHCDVDKAAARNSHGVPVDKVRQMAERLKNAVLPTDWSVEDYYG